MSIDAFAGGFARPAIEFRPEQRWWLAEGLHTDETLRCEIDTAHRLGFGGMEFLAMDEQAIDHARYGWGSEEWGHDSELVVTETTARGMAVSFTSGTNWSNANLPTIDPDHDAAAKELDVVVEHVAGGASRSGSVTPIDLEAERDHGPLPGERAVPKVQTLFAVVAARRSADAVLEVDSIIDLTPSVVDGDLDWTAPAEGDWMLFAFWMHGTGQTASPSSTVNYTVNYLDRAGVDAVIDYWDTVVLTPALRAQIARNPRTQMYMDSLELFVWGEGGMLWGADVAREFRVRRGYDITPWLPYLTRSALFMAASTVYRFEPDAAHAVEVAKVRHDYVATLTDLYIENMLRPFAAFLHERGIALRSEISYGLPFELTRPGPEVDGIETESLEFASQIDAYRLLAGPAHLFGKQYSSETGATTRNHMLEHRFDDQIIATQLAAGVTKTVLHGWASTAGAEGATEWPGHEGMWPMFSERFDTRQPAAEFYPLWTEALGRVQYTLRQGRPRIDVGILRTDHFVDNASGLALIDADGNRVPDEVGYATWWMRNRENHWWQDLGMQDAGWTYEFFDGSLLQRDEISFEDGIVQPGGPGYQALIVYQSELDADVAALLLREARRGLRVLLVHGAREVQHLMTGRHRTHERAASLTPGLDGRDDELAATIAELLALPTVAEVSSPDQTVAALRRLGVRGRAEFTADDRGILTHLREDGDLLHLYVYSFLYETGAPETARIALDGAGAVVRLDPWSGELHPHAAAVVDGRTVVEVALRPGEIALFTLDRSAPPVEPAPVADSVVAEAGAWRIAVESWDAGELELLTEDRGLGYITREVRPTTEVTTLVAADTALAPWTELAGVGPEVSGVGDYATTITLAEKRDGVRYLLDLGSTAGGLGSVRVGGGAVRGFDTSAPTVDVTDDVVAGDNAVHVRVASSLNNRLLARGYYEGVPDILADLAGGGPRPQTTFPREAGLLGPVVLREVG